MDRWMLERAGIINVYQYGVETLSFAGGRLLLRGVNGSGKSTAMNMLLPFLLEADTRRIDEAGEQSGGSGRGCCRAGTNPSPRDACGSSSPTARSTSPSGAAFGPTAPPIG
jgi:energy-coupling factor transporter ATP-binding protein EcfA2